jgi:hypothetical protein
MAALLVSTAMSVVTMSPAHALSGKSPLVVVLCKFPDQTAEPHDTAYYQDMFSESGAGKTGVFDFWRDVSYGNLDLNGTVVKGWYTADKTAAEFNTAARDRQIDMCASKADPDVDFTKFAGVVVLTNHTNFNGPLFGHGGPTTIAGTSYASLGAMAAEEDQHLSGILHETGHAFGVNHSRTVSQAPGQSDYGDSYDVMSCFGCYTTSAHSYQGVGGPGLNAVQLDTAGWLPAGRTLTLDTDNCTQQTTQMAALNHPEASGPLQARFPAAVPIVKQFTSTTSDYYSVELRSRSGWDGGIPADTFLVHLKGRDGYSYWVDGAGALTAGEQFADAVHKIYVGVNSIGETPASTGVVTLGSCKINTGLRYTGPSSAAYHETVTLTADLTVDPSGAPIPGTPVRLSLGTQDCTTNTDASGHATCSIFLDQAPGTYRVQASFAGTEAYQPRTGEATFTIDKQETALRYEGPANIANDAPATLRSTLTERGGILPVPNRSVSFTVGTGSTAQTCTGTTNGGGRAECTIPSVAQPAAATSVSVRAAFAGDDFFRPSDDSATAKVLSYAGHSYALRSTLALLPPVVVSDTGVVSTASRSSTEKSAVSASNQLVSTSALTAAVTTGDAKSTGRATAENVTIGIPGVPVIRAAAVRATAESVCDLDGFHASGSGGVTIESLSIGGIPQNTATVAPNKVIRVGPATITLNEQKPVPGSSAGIMVNAIHVAVPGIAEVVVSAAESSIRNCP